MCVVDTPRSKASAAVTTTSTTTTTTTTSTAACTANGDMSVIDLTESDDETTPTATACASATRTNCLISKSPPLAHGNSIRHAISPSPPPAAVFDLSPRNIPVSSPAAVHHNLPPSPMMVPTPPLLATPSFHPTFPAPSAAKISGIPFLGSGSSSSSGYSTLPTPTAAAAAASLHYPTNSLFGRSPYDSDVLDFLSLMSGFSDFGGFSIPPNAFDYLYQPQTSSATSRGVAVDFGLDSVLHSSPSPTIWRDCL